MTRHSANSDWRDIAGEIARFVAAGVGNTLVTVAIYQLAVGYIGPVRAYVAAWCVGILLVSLLYPRFVYRKPLSLLGAGQLILIYFAAFALGTGITALLSWLAVPARLIVFVSAGATSVFSYLFGRRALHVGSAS